MFELKDQLRNRKKMGVVQCLSIKMSTHYMQQRPLRDDVHRRDF